MRSFLRLSMWSLLVPVLGFATACVADDGQPDSLLPESRTSLGHYAELRIQLDPSPDGGVEATLTDRACVLLDDSTTVTLGGRAPATRMNGTIADGSGPPPTKQPICLSPRFTWPTAFDSEDNAPLVISDGLTTYTAVFDRPFLARTIEIAPPGAPEVLHGGGTVSLRVVPSAGALVGGGADLPGAVPEAQHADIVRWTPGSPARVMLALPSFAAASDGDIALSASFELPVVDCDAPGGCLSHATAAVALSARFAP